MESVELIIQIVAAFVFVADNYNDKVIGQTSFTEYIFCSLAYPYAFSER